MSFNGSANARRPSQCHLGWHGNQPKGLVIAGAVPGLPPCDFLASPVRELKTVGNNLLPL